MKFVRISGQVLSVTLLLACLVALIGAHSFGIPLVSPVGLVILSLCGPWLVVLPTVVVLFEVWLCRVARSRFVTVVLVVALGTAAWATTAVMRVMTLARLQGVPVSVATALRVHILRPSPPDADLVYTTSPYGPLRILVYKPRIESAGRAAPVLLYIHGGGFTQGDRFESGMNLRWFADRGWLVLSMDYNLSSDERHTWDLATPQVGCAMTWITSHATQFGGDPSRLSLMGSSAGGNLAINAGYSANAGQLVSSCGGSVPRVSTVTALYPPVDLAAAWSSQVPFVSDMARKFNTAYLGGSPQLVPERYAFVNSSARISALAPPTLVIFGDSDHLVPPDATQVFVRQAKSAGVDMVSVPFPLGEHAFNLNQYGLGNQFYLGMADRFLHEHAR